MAISFFAVFMGIPFKIMDFPFPFVGFLASFLKILGSSAKASVAFFHSPCGFFQQAS